jgi:hypothetical protein
MQVSDPTTWPAVTWAIAVSMALSGGLVNWLAHSRSVAAGHFNIIELLGELFTSGFVGIGLFMLLDSLHQPLGICAASAGIGGHMATRFLFLVERIVEARLMKATDGDIK